MAEIDWRNKDGVNYISSIKQQHYGTCGAFGLCAVIEAMLAIESNIFNVDLSEGDLFNCSSHGENNTTAINYLRALVDISINGITIDSQFPDSVAFANWPTNGPLPCIISPERDAHAYTITSWAKVPENVEALKEALLNVGPVLIGTNIVTIPGEPVPWYNVDEDYVFESLPHYLVGLGHAMSIVGFSDEGRYWIYKNSWGPTWGHNGFLKVSYDETKFFSLNQLYIIQGVKKFIPKKLRIYPKNLDPIEMFNKQIHISARGTLSIEVVDSPGTTISFQEGIENWNKTFLLQNQTQSADTYFGKIKIQVDDEIKYVVYSKQHNPQMLNNY